MGQYTSYYLYQRYEQREGQDPIPCAPNVYSVDGYGTMQKVIKIENDPECGYVPPTPTEPIYRWYQIPITEDYICNDCGSSPTEPIYRWTNSGTTCIGYDKWQRAIKEVSYDNGSSWNVSSPLQESATTLIEANSQDCGYRPPTAKKITAYYLDESEKSMVCNSSSILTCSEVVSLYSHNTSAMTNAVIGDCVTVIDSGAFGGAWGTDQETKSLSSVTIPNTVTQIGDDAFANSAITGLTLPNGLTTIGFSTDTSTGGGTFLLCKNLKTINLPSTLTRLAHRTFQDSGLESITLPSSLNKIEDYVFAFCTGLTSVTIPSSVTEIGNDAFLACSALTQINIPSTVNSIGEYAFSNCNALTSLTIPSAISVISDSAFAGCSSLTNITIPEGVTTIGNRAFGACSGVTSITIPSTVEYIGDGALSVNNELSPTTEITINRSTPPTLGTDVICTKRYYSGDTSWCELNYYIFVPSGSVDTYKEAWPDYADIIYAQGDTPVVNIGVTVHLMNTQDTIQVSCDDLDDITFTDETTVKVVKLPNVSPPYGYTASSCTIGDCVGAIYSNTFKNASGYTSITMPNSIIYIGSSAFFGCTNLPNITLSSSLMTIEQKTFSGCSSLTSIEIPDSVTTIGNSAFTDCSGMTSVTIGSGVTSINDNAFRRCTSLNSLTVKATTPPTLRQYALYQTNGCPIYVPSESVEAYKSAWDTYAYRIQAIP